MPHFDHTALDRIRPADVEDLMRRMRAKGLSAKSIRNYLGTLSALFNYAVRKRWAKANPVREVDLPKPPSNDEIRFVTLDEINALADAAVAGPYRALDRAMYLTAAMTGLRVGELIALRWRDVDFVAGRVRVRRNYVLGEFGTPKSRRSSRSVPLDDSLAGELDRLARAAAREQAEPDPDALVFPSPHNGEPLSKGKFCAATGVRSRPRGSTRPTASMTCAMRSARWPRPRACLCAYCRNGWATATSPPPSATPTTRRARTRRRSSERCSRSGAARSWSPRLRSSAPTREALAKRLAKPWRGMGAATAARVPAQCAGCLYSPA